MLVDFLMGHHTYIGIEVESMMNLGYHTYIGIEVEREWVLIILVWLWFESLCDFIIDSSVYCHANLTITSLHDFPNYSITSSVSIDMSNYHHFMSHFSINDRVINVYRSNHD